jgi:acyl-CoA thioesterase
MASDRTAARRLRRGIKGIWPRVQRRRFASLRRVGDLGTDSAVSGQDGRYQATLSDSWEIWGPQGGYVAAVALRAAGAESPFPHPASFICHYLRVAEFGPCEIRVVSLRQAKRAESLRVTVEQNGIPVLEGLVWTVAELTGIDHDAAPMPQVPPPEDVESWDTYWPGGEPPFPFWRSFDVRPVTPHPSEWARATTPTLLGWVRLRTRPPLEDPFVDAGRMLVVADATMYPAATLAHDGVFPYIAPSMDLAMSFHQMADSDWLLVDARSSLSTHALVAGQASIWSVDGQMLGSAMQQMLQRT